MPRFFTCLIAVFAVCVLAQSSAMAAPRVPVPEPTVKNMAYGPHERNVFDLWKAPGKDGAPTPLLFVIHGGGWLNNDKDKFMAGAHGKDMAWYLENGISVAAINYRYSTIAPLPAPVHDAARALQFIRSKAAEFGIDPTRVIATGNSAGACTSLWLATHDDLADPASEDPVARQSTRLTAAWVGVPQTSIDPPQLQEWFGEERPVTHGMIHSAGGFKNRAAMLEGYKDPAVAALYKEFSPINHLTKDDPVMVLHSNGKLDRTNDTIHHPIFGKHFKDKAIEVGAPVILVNRDEPEISDTQPIWHDFLLDTFTLTEKAAP